MNLYDLSIGEDKMNQFLSIALKTHFESSEGWRKGRKLLAMLSSFFKVL